jgi:hypothetical protein
MMDYRLGGTVMGDRTIEGCGNMVFEDLTNNVKAFLIFNTYKKSGFWSTTETGRKDEFFGLIYKTVKPIDPVQSYKTYYSKNAKEIRELSGIDFEVGEKICEVKGSFLKNIIIDEKEYWNIDVDIPFRQIPMIDGDGK